MASTAQSAPARKTAASEDLLGKALDRTLLRRIFSYVWPYKWQIIVATALLPLIALFEIARALARR